MKQQEEARKASHRLVKKLKFNRTNYGQSKVKGQLEDIER
jgi:hypothetical protein